MFLNCWAASRCSTVTGEWVALAERPRRRGDRAPGGGGLVALVAPPTAATTRLNTFSGLSQALAVTVSTCGYSEGFKGRQQPGWCQQCSLLGTGFSDMEAFSMSNKQYVTFFSANAMK